MRKPLSKKGQIAMGSAIIGVVILVIFMAYVFIPQAKTMTTPTPQTDSAIIHVYDGENETRSTLTQTPLTGTLNIPGLTITDNYTFDTSTLIVAILNTTSTGNYTPSYTYAGSQYLTSAGDRSLAAVIVLAGIISILYIIFRTFGLI